MKILGRRKNRNHIVLAMIICVILISIAIGVWLYLTGYNKTPKTNKEIVTTQAQKKQNIEKQNTVIHMAAMGDMLAHDTIIANATTETSYNFKHYFDNIRSIYHDANIVFCNQEGLSSGEAYGISGYPSFNAPTQFAADLQSGAGCNFINLANNHMGDKGVAATNATIDVWNGLKPLAVSGANKNADDQKKVSYSTVNGIKFGFVAFADFNNNTSTPDYSVNIYHDEALVRRLVTEARANSDIVLVSMHWGVEDSNIVSADQQNEANLLSSLGVDVIIGTGPHVLQKVQTITRDDGGKTVVWYSLGNMLSSQLNIKELIGGIAQFDIVKNTDNKMSINNLSFTPTYMHYEWTASQAANNDLLARHNAMIYLLSAAADPLSRSLFNTTVAEQKQYVIDTLGSEVTVK
jgi:poly-gamma-glutamate synthesis protein (capsule biosynthesis protein)